MACEREELHPLGLDRKLLQGLVTTTKGEGDDHLGPGSLLNEASVENNITVSKNCTCGISTGRCKATCPYGP